MGGVGSRTTWQLWGAFGVAVDHGEEGGGVSQLAIDRKSDKFEEVS
jgi:hypothetical protein